MVTQALHLFEDLQLFFAVNSRHIIEHLRTTCAASLRPSGRMGPNLSRCCSRLPHHHKAAASARVGLIRARVRVRARVKVRVRVGGRVRVSFRV